MTCLVCASRAQLSLCPRCITRMNEYLDNLPWLLHQLDITLNRQDHLTGYSLGGKSSDTPAPINFDALETHAKVRQVLVDAVKRLKLSGEQIRPPHTVHPSFIGPLPDGWQRLHFVPTTPFYCHWLMTHRRRIPKSMHAGDILRDLADLAGPDQGTGGGALVVAINRNERRYYGPCAQFAGRDRHGQPRECGADIYGPRDADMVTCPDCGVSVSAQYQLDQTEARTDLRTMDMLIDAMRNLGEVVGRNRVQSWINAEWLQRRGYYNPDRGIVKKRIRRGDPAVYSLKQARDLWSRQTKHQQKAGTK